MFTARYAQSPYIKQISFVFKCPHAEGLKSEGNTLLACEVKWFGIALWSHRQNIKGIQKFSFSGTTLRILVPSIINWGVHLNSRNCRSSNCASYPRELCDKTNIVREWSGPPEIINKLTYVVFRQKHLGTLTTFFTISTQVIHRFALWTHLLSTYEAQTTHDAFQCPVCTPYQRKQTETGLSAC